MQFYIEQCQPSEGGKKRVNKTCGLFLARDLHQIHGVSEKAQAKDLVVEVRNKKEIL